MTLKLNLAPGESILIGKARVQNAGDRRCMLLVTGNEKILRGRRIMLERDATSPMKRLYFMAQSIYLSDDNESLYSLYHDVAREGVQAWPLLTMAITDVSELILAGKDYEAMNAAQTLVEVEQELLDQLAKEAK